MKGTYIARTDNEASLSVEDICAALKNRGGFTGSYDDLVENVHQFFDEAAYQLCDGFEVNTKYFSLYPTVGGTFDKVTKVHDTHKHPVTFHLRAHAALRRLAERIIVEVEGIANISGSLDEFVDITTESVNDVLTPEGLFSITGYKLKLLGDAPDVGVYFVSVDNSGLRVKVSGHLAQNTASKLIGVIPALEAGMWKVAVKTQYTGSGNAALKTPRVIESTFTLIVLDTTSK
jgi:hypothetical protein